MPPCFPRYPNQAGDDRAGFAFYEGGTMSIRIMSQIWETKAKEPNGSELLVLLALADQANDDGVCWPGMTRLARKCRMSRRYLIEHIKSLESRGLISKEKGGSRLGTNIYTVHLDSPVNPSSLPSESQFTTTSEPQFTGVVNPSSSEPSVNHHTKPSKNHQEDIAPAAQPADAGETPEPAEPAKKSKRQQKAKKDDAETDAPELVQAKTELARAYWRCLSKVEQELHTARKDYGRFVKEARPGAIAGVTPDRIAPAFQALKKDFRFRERTPAVRDVLDYIAAHAPVVVSASELEARAGRANAEYDALQAERAAPPEPSAAERIWDGARDLLRQRMTAAVWETSIGLASGESLDGDVLTVAFPSRMVIERIVGRPSFRRVIDECVHSVTGNGTQVRYMVRDTREIIGEAA
jgi:hypothetical protein